MNRTKSFNVGFVFFVASVICVTSILWVGSGQAFFEDQAYYTVHASSTSGLRPGSRVFLSGVLVGTVSEIRFFDDLRVNKVRVTLAVDKGVAARIREDSFVWLQSEGLLGDMSVQISMGTRDKPALREKGEIEYKPRSILEDLAGQDISLSAADLLENTIAVLTEINSGKGTIGQLLKSPDLYNNLNDFTKSMNQVTGEVDTITREMNAVLAELRSQKGTLGKLIFSEGYEKEFSKAIRESTQLMESLRVITESVANGKGVLARMIDDPTLYDKSLVLFESLASASSTISGLLAQADKNQSALGRLMTDATTGEKLVSLVDRLERSATSLEKVLDLLVRGEGSLGMALHDPSLAISLRNVFLGVRESGLVQNMVRNAETEGREVWLREGKLSEETRRQVLRARALAGLGQTGGPGTGLDAQPVPATAPKTSESPQPATLPENDAE